MMILRSLIYFALAGVCEVGGGYLVWQSVKNGKPVWYGIAGGLALILYGLIATLQTANFARTYAAYGGIFIVLSLAWGWKVDSLKIDKFDIIGCVIALIGVFIIIYSPRK